MDDRTQIAALVLQGLVANPDLWDADYKDNVRVLSKMSVEYADALREYLSTSSPGPAPRIGSPPPGPVVPPPGEEVKPKPPMRVFECESDRYVGDGPCVGRTTRDAVSMGWFCVLHIEIHESIRREWHKRNGHRNRPKDEAR